MNALRRLISTSLVVIAAVAAGLLGYSVFTMTPFYHNMQFARAKEEVQTSRDQLSKAEDLATVFRNVGKVVEPSVVNIEVHKTIKGVRNNLDDNMLRRFFPHDQLPDLPESDSPEQEQIGTGSGVIMDVDGSTGYILTNNHVAGDAEVMDVTLSDGRVIKGAKLVGNDPKSDMAVVKITADHLIPARWGDSSQLQKGDWILAFGSPFGYVGSMTHGIVSALDRQAGILGQQGYEDFIQVDAPINPGNSGGPLVNLQGDVVGINTAIASRSGGFQGIGFAIPSNQAKYVYKALKEKGKVTRGWLGVSIRDVASDLPSAKSFGFDGTAGVLVEETFAKTPANGKLQAGDIVTELNTKPTHDVMQLRNAIAATVPGTDVTLKVWRDSKFQDVVLKVGTQPEDLAAATGRTGVNGEPTATENPGTAEAIGMKLTDLTGDLAQKYALGDVKDGALIISVQPRSAAFRAGLRAGDVISRVNKLAITSAKDAGDALSKADLKKGVRMYVSSRDGSRFVFLRDGKE